MDELISNAPHDGPALSEDNSTVLHLLQDMLAYTSHVLSMKYFKINIDGRCAFQAIQRQIMGNSKWDQVLEYA